MKRIILLLFVVNLSFSQTYRVKTEYDPWLDVYNSTVTKENNSTPYGRPAYKPEIKSFVPNYELLNSTLNKREENYENNWRLVNSAYSQVMKEKLLSKTNEAYLESWQNHIEKFLKNLNVDWSVNKNYALQTRKWILSIYEYENIKSEIMLLNAINENFNRIKKKYPNSFDKNAAFVLLDHSNPDLVKIWKRAMDPLMELIQIEDNRIMYSIDGVVQPDSYLAKKILEIGYKYKLF